MANNCCTDLSSCNGLTYSSNCVLWADDDITTYSISKGDNLTSIISTITDNLDDLYAGKNILLPDVTLANCSIISDKLGSSTKNLTNILQVLIDYQCTLKSYVDTKTGTTPATYDVKCLTVSDSKESTLIQAIVDQICTNKSNISDNTTDISTNSSAITTLKSQMATVLGDASSTVPAFTPSQLLSPWCPVPYIGPTSNFDSDGVGLANKGYDKVYIMNGKNGTQDWRGYIPMGANSGVAGGTVDSRVLPSSNNSFTLTAGQKAGEIYHTLSITEIPSHSHTVTDPGHSHDYTGPKLNQGHPSGSKDHEARYNQTNSTSTERTGITIANAGGGKGHNNIPPVVGVVWIVKIP